jgi:hypothetical protein
MQYIILNCSSHLHSCINTSHNCHPHRGPISNPPETSPNLPHCPSPSPSPSPRPTLLFSCLAARLAAAQPNAQYPLRVIRPSSFCLPLRALRATRRSAYDSHPNHDPSGSIYAALAYHPPPLSLSPWKKPKKITRKKKTSTHIKKKSKIEINLGWALQAYIITYSS